MTQLLVGNYQLLKGDSLVAALSFNEAGTESDLTYLSDNQIQEMLPEQNVELLNASSGTLLNTLKSVNQGFPLWKLCLILALIFFALEILIIRFYKNKLNP